MTFILHTIQNVASVIKGVPAQKIIQAIRNMFDECC